MRREDLLDSIDKKDAMRSSTVHQVSMTANCVNEMDALVTRSQSPESFLTSSIPNRKLVLFIVRRPIDDFNFIVYSNCSLSLFVRQEQIVGIFQSVDDTQRHEDKGNRQGI